MSTSKQDRDATTPPPDQSTVILLLADIADTTWRMFLPILSGVGLGFWGDTRFGTTPWLVLAGLVLGIVLTSLLIYRQFKKVQKR